MADWSREEVEATVADYFDMLDHEVRALDFNKAAHRRALAPLLNQRSDGAIERKHQNISAVLIELGFVYISGYKPLSNYQQLLFDVVAARLGASDRLVAAVRQQVSEPAPVPSVDDILTALVEPPRSDPERASYQSLAARDRATVRRGVDYLALEANNRSLGEAGEEFVLRFEIARLLAARQERLAKLVERVSITRGDGLGYDILSFEEPGRERLIEVKTTNYGPSTPFYVTKRELAFSQEMTEQFHLYRAFEFRRRPRIFLKQGPLDRSFVMEPSQFKATMG
jgi:hypothetical protein